jgi:hypothetical protein
LYGNNRPQNIVVGGINNLNASFTNTSGITYETNLSVMSLWLGGLDSTGLIRTATNLYGFNSGTDFYAGPNLPISEDSLLKNSKDYDKIWKMTAVEIAAFKEDLKDGLLNGAFPNIFAWPARNNSYSAAFNGFSLPKNVDLAPFKDTDNDGNYDPMKGDFPILEGFSETNLPAVFYWCVYHDKGTHTFSKGKSMNIEVHQSSWLYDCKSDTILNNSLFFSYKIFNKGTKAIDSLFVGMAMENEFNCMNRRMIGCSPNQNTFWAYQNSSYDEQCSPSVIGKNIKPVVALTFLNNPMHAFVATGYIPNDISGHYRVPENVFDFYNVLNGKWSNGGNITCCGQGYEPNTKKEPTRFFLSDNPNKIGGWSMQQNQTTIPIAGYLGTGSVDLKKLLPNQSQRIDLAISYHQDTTHRNVLQATDLMYRNITTLQNVYNQKVALENCFVIDSCSGNDCVYPGDLNHDGIANLYDQIDYYTMYNSPKGKTRKGTIYWTPQQAENWNSLQLNGSDLKHGDADGNGSISTNDYNTILDNYGNTTPFYTRPKDEFVEGKDFFFSKLSKDLDTLDFDFFAPTYDLQLSKLVIPNFRAAAFQIEYDRRVFNRMTFVPAPISERTIGNVQEVDFFDDLSTAKISKITLKTNDDYIEANKLPTPCTSIRIKNIKAVRKDGTLITNLGSKDYVICFNSQFVATKEFRGNLNISIYPNPFENQIIIENNNPQKIDYQIFNIQNQLLQKGEILSENRQVLDTDFLPKGIYFIELKGENGARKVEKLVKM